jgi:predicted RNase H-like HicB family nuclease
MSKYTVFFERTGTGYSAHVPDLPGCVAAAATLEETRELIREPIEFHIEGMRIHGTLFLNRPRISNRSKSRRELVEKRPGRGPRPIPDLQDHIVPEHTYRVTEEDPTIHVQLRAKLFNGFVISNPSSRLQFCPLS